jgi:ribonuclease-3
MPLLIQALTRKAYAEEEVQAGRRCEFQESLSFLGDAVLRAALSELLIERGWSSKDYLHRERKDLENNEQLTKVGEKLVTRAVIRMNKSESDSWETNKTTVLSDTMEALIGAIHLAAGYEESKMRVASWFE